MPDKECLEVELKLRLLNMEDRDSIFTAPGIVGLNAPEPVMELMHSTYFDSAGGALQKAGLAYRLRSEGGRWIATVKGGGSSGGGLHERQEWNVPIASDRPSIEYFEGTPVGPLLQEALDGSQLEAILETVFERRKAVLTTFDGSRIEVAVDIGKIIAGQSEETIGEVELELKEGNPAAVLTLGADLAAWIPLAVEPRSKYYRGLCLAGVTAKAEIEPAVDMSANAAKGMCQLCINQIHRILNEQGEFCSRPTGVGEIHKLRLELRRLGAMLSLAQPMAAAADYSAWQEVLSSWSQDFARLRELELANDLWGKSIQGVELVPPPWLGLFLEKEREKLAQEAVDSLRTGALTATLLRLWAWLLEDPFPQADEVHLREFAAVRFFEWIDKLWNMDKEIEVNDREKLSAIRLQSKSLRYLFEVLPFEDASTKLLKLRLKRLQKQLEVLRNSEKGQQFFKEWMSMHGSRIVCRDVGFVSGWLERDARKARNRVEKVWKSYRRAMKRWRANAQRKPVG